MKRKPPSSAASDARRKEISLYDAESFHSIDRRRLVVPTFTLGDREGATRFLSVYDGWPEGYARLEVLDMEALLVALHLQPGGAAELLP